MYYIAYSVCNRQGDKEFHNRMPVVLDESELEDWVYDDKFTEYALHKIPPKLWRKQEYEQQSLFLT